VSSCVDDMSTPNPFGFSVLGVANLNDDLMVAYLKDEIVKEMPGLFAADELVIWKVGTFLHLL